MFVWTGQAHPAVTMDVGTGQAHPAVLLTGEALTRCTHITVGAVDFLVIVDTDQLSLQYRNR